MVERASTKRRVHARHRILIVHRDAHQTELLAQLLEDLGHQCGRATTEAAALAIAATLQPTVVLLDIQLPDLDGYTFTRHLRAAADDPIHVVALIRWGNPEDRTRAQEAGVDDRLPTPIDKTQLLAALDRAARPPTTN